MVWPPRIVGMPFGASLPPGRLARLAASGGPFTLPQDARSRMAAAREELERFLADGRPHYGLNTGVGALKNTVLSAEDLRRHQVLLVRSHAAGSGPPLPARLVRAATLLRARSLSLGPSGVRPEVVDALAALASSGLRPWVPSVGSLGASGDIAPLAHLALLLIGEGWVDEAGRPVPAGPSLAAAGLVPLELEAKEALSLVNGTAFMAAALALAVVDGQQALRLADLAAAASIEALFGSTGPFRSELLAARGHPGEMRTGEVVSALLADSPLVASHAGCDRVQDAYSMRCVPQVHGAARDAIAYAGEVATREADAVVDNPVLVGGDLVSGGLFHGQPLAVAGAPLGLALAEVAALAERRLNRLVHPALNEGLPPFLTEEPGIGSGMMIIHYQAVARVAEGRRRAAPSLGASLPVSGDQEDYSSMALHALLDLDEVVAAIREVAVLELLAAREGLARRDDPPGPAVAAAVSWLDERIGRFTEDRSPAAEIDALLAGLAEGDDPVGAAWSAAGIQP